MRLSSNGDLRRFLNGFSSVIRFHCDKPSLGFPSLGVVADGAIGIRDNGFKVAQEMGLWH